MSMMTRHADLRHLRPSLRGPWGHIYSRLRNLTLAEGEAQREHQTT